MDDARRREADRLFGEALDRPARERDAFLKDACGGDAELRELVDRLLSHAETQGSFLNEGGALDGALGEHISKDDPLRERAAEKVPEGTRLGPFRVDEEIGRGGMAVVYSGERDDGTFAQRVAIKVLKRGLDTDEIVRRFERERAILGRIEHPDIARIYDGGSTEDGRPYLVMELVEGQPIDAYCRERDLSVEERLTLFMRAARAVAAAHRDLVVHRDIKPSNVLATEDGSVKLLDFGIAKLLDENEPGATATATGLALMTPAYASPEQVLGAAITTATDVYQLGVLLYVLLAGTTPHAAGGGSPATVAQRIVKDVPPRLPRDHGGDLEAIVMKALAKEPDERYASVGQLVDDVERFLAGRPIMARPYTFMYRARLFVRRNGFVVGALCTVALLLVAFAITSGLQARRIAEERDRANREAEASGEAADYFASLFAEADPDLLKGETLSALDLLDTGTERLDERLGDQPLVRARIALTLGGIYQKLSDHERAGALHADALEVLSGMSNLDARERDMLLTARFSLGTVYSSLGRFDEATKLLEAALEESRELYGPTHEHTLGILNNLGLIASGSADFARAEELLTEAYEARLETAGPHHEQTLQSRMNIAILYQRQGKLEDARALLEEILEARLETQGENARTTLDTRYNLGALVLSLGDPERAAEEIGLAYEGYGRTLGEANPRTLRAMQTLARIRSAQGHPDEARRLMDEGWRTADTLLGPDDPLRGTLAEQLAFALYEMGDYAAAEERLRFVWEHRKKAFGPDHAKSLRALFNVGAIAARQGKRREALAALDELMTRGYTESNPADDEDWAPLHDDPEFRRLVAHLSR